MKRPRFPLFIPSKGRWESRLTVKALEEMGADFRVVVEEQERDAYASVIDPKRLLILDPEYKRSYETCDDLGDTMPKGSGPARNFIWDTAVSEGHEWHWIMDDNIRQFVRLHQNTKIRVNHPVFFRMMEDFVLRYRNVAMAGPAYEMFAPRKKAHTIPPFVMNTRIYSCNLIRNDTPYRWSGRFNEDTHLSLRMLKDGWCTIQFYAFLQDKQATQQMKGGNTDTIYTNGTQAKSEMIARLHPDVAKVIWRFNRIHHYVDYKLFRKNKLLRREGAEIQAGSDDYGLTLSKRAPPKRSATPKKRASRPRRSSSQQQR